MGGIKKMKDEELNAIAGGTYEETAELVEWCNAHGSSIELVAPGDPSYRMMGLDAGADLIKYINSHGGNARSFRLSPSNTNTYVLSINGEETTYSHSELMDYLKTLE